MDQTGNGARPRSLKAGESRRGLDGPAAALARGVLLASLVAAETETKTGKRKAWTLQTSFGSEGSDVSELNDPTGVFASADALTAFVADSGNDRIAVWTRSSERSTDWTHQTTFGSTGSFADQLVRPAGVFASGDGLTAFVTEQGNHRISVWTRSSASSTDWVNQTTFASVFAFPSGVFVSPDGLTAYVADAGIHHISVWRRSTGSSTNWTYQTAFGPTGGNPGESEGPERVFVSPDGKMALVADYDYDRLSVWERSTGSSNWNHQVTFGDSEITFPRRVFVSDDALTALVADDIADRISVWTRGGASSTDWIHQMTFNFGGVMTRDSGFHSPHDVFVSGDGQTAFVTEEGNHRVSVWTRSTERSTDWTQQTTFGHKGSGAGRFVVPHGISVTGDGTTALVADSNNNRISLWTCSSASTTDWAQQTTFGSGPGRDPHEFFAPSDVFVSTDGRTAYVADSGNDRVSVWTRSTERSTDWTNQTTFGTYGSDRSQFNSPRGVFGSGDGLTAFVADSLNNRISVWTRSSASSTDWTPQTTFGRDGSGPSEFHIPEGVFVSEDGLTVFVAAPLNNRISVWTRSNATSTDWVKQSTFGAYGNGTSRLHLPKGVCVSRDGLTAWIADQRNHRVSVWRRSTESSVDWIYQTIFGTSRLNLPKKGVFVSGGAVSADGLTALVAEYGNDHIAVWTRSSERSTDWTHQTTFGTWGSGTDRFYYPSRVSVSPDGLTAYVADTHNHRICVWARSNPISTDWMHQTTFGTKGTGASEFQDPRGVFVSKDGLTVFVADENNARIAVWTRSIATSTSWVNQTTFGSAGSGASEFHSPGDVAVSRDGLTAFVADTGNHRISVWARSSPTSTDWVNHTTFGRKGSGARGLDGPEAVFVSEDGKTVWVADTGNARISVWRHNERSSKWTHQTTFGGESSDDEQFRSLSGVFVSQDSLTAWVTDNYNNCISVWTRSSATSTDWTHQTSFGSPGTNDSRLWGPEGTFVSPGQVFVSADGKTSWVADTHNHRISVWTSV